MDDGSTKRITLLVVTVGAFLTPFDVSSVNVALPSIGKEFSMDAISLSWVATAYLLASAIFVYPAFLRSMRSAFIFFAVLCSGGVFASFIGGKVTK